MLCAGTLACLLVGAWLGVLLIGASALIVLVLLGQLWLSERAYRVSEQARDTHFAKERELGRSQLRQRGD